MFQLQRDNLFSIIWVKKTADVWTKIHKSAIFTFNRIGINRGEIWGQPRPSSISGGTPSNFPAMYLFINLIIKHINCYNTFKAK